MTCVEFQKRLSAYMDGELPRWTRWKIQIHLGRCSDCAGLLEEFEEVDGAILAAAGACEQPAYLEDAVMRRLPAMPPAWRRQGVTMRWATGVALAGMQIMAVYGAYWWGFAKGNSTPGPDQRGGMRSPAIGSTLQPIAPRGNSPRSAPAPKAPFSLWSYPGGGGADLIEPQPPTNTSSATTRRRKASTRTPALKLSGAH
jgi:hypothetical protein